MNDVEFPDEYYMNVELLKEQYEGKEFPAHYEDKNHLECDFCSVGIPYKKEPRVGHYLADKVVIETSEQQRMLNEQRVLSSLATYCQDCSWDNVYFPAKGFTEVRAFFTIDENRIMRDFEVTDISPVDEGIPWNPEELLERITQHSSVSFKRFVEASEGEFMSGPENIVTFCFALGDIDLRALVNWDGSINEKELGQARRKYEKLVQNRAGVSSRSEARKQFRDHVRENWHV